MGFLCIVSSSCDARAGQLQELTTEALQQQCSSLSSLSHGCGVCGTARLLLLPLLCAATHHTARLQQEELVKQVEDFALWLVDGCDDCAGVSGGGACCQGLQGADQAQGSHAVKTTGGLVTGKQQAPARKTNGQAAHRVRGAGTDTSADT